MIAIRMAGVTDQLSSSAVLCEGLTSATSPTLDRRYLMPKPITMPTIGMKKIADTQKM